MSGFSSDPASAQLPWREQPVERSTTGVAVPQEQDGGHQQHQQHPQHHSTLPQQHPSQSQQQTSPHLPHPHHYDRYSPALATETEDDYREWRSAAPLEAGSPHSHTSGGSIIGSPHSQQSSQSARRGSDMSVGAPVTSPHGEQRMTLGERRQEKRKMKRFRLTHNQTRFLMSEFARQAHPDAAHRERLAREIPGLSPRQVQVWFQNRRAKLKRMSSDDRESMVKSRTLPEQFPILQTLHTPYGRGIIGTPLSSPTEYSPITEPQFRPDQLRRQHEMAGHGVISPTNSAFGTISYNPPASSGEMLSPASSSGERTPYGAYMTAPLPQQRGNPFSRPSDPYRVPRLQLQDTHTPRSIAEPQTTPVRTTAYGASPMEHHGEYQLSPGYTMSGMPFVEPPRSVPPEGPTSPYVHSAQQAHYSHGYPSPAPPSATQNRPPPFPSPLGLSDYKYGQGPMTPHSASMSPFPTAPLAPPQDFQIPQLSAPPESTTFSSSYLTSRPGGSYQPGVNPGTPTTETSDAGRRESGHQRKRSSSQPPHYAQQANPTR